MRCSQSSNRLQHLLPTAVADVDTFVDQLLGPTSARRSSWRATAAIWEGENQFFVEIDAPGVQTDDIEVTFEKNQLSLTLERNAPEHDGKLWHSERGYGKVNRTLTLPETVDPETIDAALSDGVLRVTIDKRPELQPKRIDVKSA